MWRRCRGRQCLSVSAGCLPPQNPNDISYVHSGYAPLSVRLTQLLARPGWRSIEEVLKMLPGPHFEERQQLPSGLHKKRVYGRGGGAGWGPSASLSHVPDTDKVWAWFMGEVEQRVRARHDVCLSSVCLSVRPYGRGRTGRHWWCAWETVYLLRQ